MRLVTSRIGTHHEGNGLTTCHAALQPQDGEASPQPPEALQSADDAASSLGQRHPDVVRRERQPALRAGDRWIWLGFGLGLGFELG